MIKDTITGFFRVALLWVILAMTQRIFSQNHFVTVKPSAGEPLEAETAQNQNESRPAEDDPEGNWGEPTNGFRLSIRVETNVFHVGQPILANVLLRNVGDTPLEYSFARGKGFGLCRFSMTWEGRESLNRIDEQSLGGFSGLKLYPKTQWKWPVRIDKMFSVKMPGTYLLAGVGGGTGGSPEIRSANLLIRVIAEDSAETRTNASPVKPTTNPGSAKNTSANIGAEKALPGAIAPHSSESSTTHAPNAPSSQALGSSPVASASPPHDTGNLTLRQKVGAGAIGTLLALVLAILWRAARRKPEA